MWVCKKERGRHTFSGEKGEREIERSCVMAICGVIDKKNASSVSDAIEKVIKVNLNLRLFVLEFALKASNCTERI